MSAGAAKMVLLQKMHEEGLETTLFKSSYFLPNSVVHVQPQRHPFAVLGLSSRSGQFGVPMASQFLAVCWLARGNFPASRKKQGNGEKKKGRENEKDAGKE